MKQEEEKETLSEPTPSKISALESTGVFMEEGRAADKFRQFLVADALSKFQRAQNDRWRQERQWYLNMAFFFGNQHSRFRSTDITNFDLYTPPAPYYRVRQVINHIRKVVRKEISRLTSQKPNAYIIPASSDDRDVFAAQAGEQIWNYVWREYEFQTILEHAVFWQTLCGNGFIKQFWDPSKRDKEQNQGDIDLISVTPFHLFVPDLLSYNIEHQPYVIHAQMRNNDWIRNVLEIEPGNKQYSVIEESMKAVMNISSTLDKNTSAVLEFWVKPNIINGLEKGGMFTIVNNQLIQGVEGFPNQLTEYPFSKINAIPSGKFYNDSVLVDLIPLQRELNRSRSQTVENRNRMAKERLVAEEGSVDPSRITSEPGQTILYKPGYQAPQPLPMQNLPSYVADIENRIYTDISDLSGQHEVSEGRVPPGVTAATAISFLTEQDETLISTHHRSIEGAVEKTSKQVLVIIKERWDEERTIKVVSEDSSFDVFAFKGSDLRNNTDIHIESGSSLPTSRAAKQAFITDMMKMGFIDPKEGLEVLEIGGLNRIYERVQVDTRQAQRENLRMRIVTEQDLIEHITSWSQENETLQTDAESGLKLEPPLIVPTNSWDNDAVHIEVHNRFRKSQAYDRLPKHVKILFELHVSEHEEKLMFSPEAFTDPSQQGMEQQGAPGPMPDPTQQQGMPEDPV